ncbi:MAG: PglZ domain-containing protein [Sandaracinaceae bacterium]
MRDAIELGPVSELLASEVRQRVQQQGVVVWLDADEQYTGFVDRLREAKPGYRVEGYRGSHLELMLALEGQTSGVDKPRLLVHLPGFNEETVKQTPLYELYRAGVRYRKSLSTLVEEAASGKVKPEAIGAFAGGLEDADAWLRAEMDAHEGGFAAQLRAIGPRALADHLIRKDEYILQKLGADAAVQTIWEYLEVALALRPSWRASALAEVPEARAWQITTAMSSWALAMEYVDDLQRAPRAPDLVGMENAAKPIVERCRELAAHVRAQHPDEYRRIARETESRLPREVDEARGEDLGRVDTFAFEEDALRLSAIRALQAARWDQAAEWADDRLHGESFWVAQDMMRRHAWELIRLTAALGQAIARAGDRLDANDFHGALERYEKQGEGVDRAHRVLEQAARKLLGSRVPDYEDLRARIEEARARWRAWADGWTGDFSAICERQGFLPPSSLQQRRLFEEVVRPHVQEGTTAYFMVDAFRFEMAVELRQSMERTKGARVDLAARYAELPTNTDVGMDVLAPVESGGKLRPRVKGDRFAGFESGEFRVHNPETRRRAIHAKVGGATCPLLTLADVLSRDGAKLRQTVKQADLLVIHSDEIDKAGESTVGASAFADAMLQLRSAWQLLHDAGVKRFVFTADHGFLLLEGQAAGEPIECGRTKDGSRRHMIAATPGAPDGVVSVPLAELGYEGVEGHLYLARSTAQFDVGGRKKRFVHGGNSLQERVIPVLTLVHRTSAGGTNVRYRVEARAVDPVEDMHCIEAKVVLEGQAGLEFAGASELELALQVEDLPDVAVELCSARRGARLRHGALVAQVGEDFEVFFRLTGETDARPRVVLVHPSRVVELEPGGPEARFAVGVPARAKSEPATPGPKPAPDEVKKDRSWLQLLPEGVKTVFAHIEAHGVCVSTEAEKMLGGARQLRRFSRQFEAHAAKAPFSARIEVVGGVKRYVRVKGKDDA